MSAPLSIDTSTATTAPTHHNAVHEPRHFHTAAGTIEREGEVAEREMADYGADYPAGPPPMLGSPVSFESPSFPVDGNEKAEQPKKLPRNRNASLSEGGRRLTKMRSDGSGAMEFPPLHLVDSAFEDAHRVLTRNSQRQSHF